MNESGLLGVVETLRAEGKGDAAAAVLEAGAVRYGRSCRWRVGRVGRVGAEGGVWREAGGVCSSRP